MTQTKPRRSRRSCASWVLDVEVRLVQDFQAALAEAERLTGGRRKHFAPKPGGDRPYDPKPGQGQIDFEAAA